MVMSEPLIWSKSWRPSLARPHPPRQVGVWKGNGTPDFSGEIHVAEIWFQFGQNILVYLPDYTIKINHPYPWIGRWNIPFGSSHWWSCERTLPNPPEPRNFEWVSYVWSLLPVIFWASWLGTVHGWMEVVVPWNFHPSFPGDVAWWFEKTLGLGPPTH